MNGYSKTIVKNIYRKRKKELNKLESRQKPKPKITALIPYIVKTTTILKSEAQKINFYVPIKPNPNIFQRIRPDRDKIDSKETSGAYKIEYETEEGINKCYIGVTKRKIKERIREHQSDIKYEKRTTALAREAAENNIKRMKIILIYRK